MLTGAPAPCPGRRVRGARAGCASATNCPSARVLDGRLPAVVPEARRDPRTRDLPVTAELGIGAYAGAAIRGASGGVVVMLCCTSVGARPDLDGRDQAVLELLAGALGELLDVPEEDVTALRARVSTVMAGHGRSIVLHPIVDVRTGRSPGAEALSRFTAAPVRPDLWFTDAERVGLRVPLELAAAQDALTTLHGPDAPGFLSINLSPDTLLSRELTDLLHGHDLTRVVLEVTEHAAVADDDALTAALRDHRAAGLRLAVDDAGAGFGFASLRHILRLQPDVIKLDISLVTGIDTDPVEQALASSLVSFAQATGARLVGEGVETQAEYDTLARLGVDLRPGLPARPTRPASGRRPTPAAVTAHVPSYSRGPGPQRRARSSPRGNPRGRQPAAGSSPSRTGTCACLLTDLQHLSRQPRSHRPVPAGWSTRSSSSARVGSRRA